MDDIEYGSFTLQQYLDSPQFSAEEVSLLLAIRTRTVRGIRSDFGAMFPDKRCPMPGCEEQDSLSHALVCGVLRDELPDVDFSDVSLRDAFSGDLLAQKRITVVYSKLLEMRERILVFLLTDDDDDVDDDTEDEVEE